MRRVAIYKLFFFISLAIPVAGQNRNAAFIITGIVVDEREHAIAGAKVCTTVILPMQPCGNSDQDGKFSIALEHSGTYTLYAEQFEQGYPIATWPFYGKLWLRLPTVTIDKTSGSDQVKIKVGPKAGRLILTILDWGTDEPIERGDIEFCRVNEPQSCWSTMTPWPKGHFEVLTPEVPFTMKFKSWQGHWVDRKAVDEAGVPVETVKVELGGQKEMTVRLN